MKFKTNISFIEYVRLIYSLAYERTLLRLLLGVAGLILMWIILYYLDIFDLPKPVIYQYMTLFLITVVQPVGIFLTTRRNYHSSNQLRETLAIEANSEEIKIDGESYYMEVKWEKLFKIVEKTHWFLLYQNNITAIIIHKRDMAEGDIERFRGFFKDLKEVPIEL